MSRATRPLRRVRGGEREALLAAVSEPTRWSVAGAELYPRAYGRTAFEHGGRRLGCRPAQLRRCLLGLPVSARAAAKILAAACGHSTGRDPGR